jgi:hypothetical protein
MALSRRWHFLWALVFLAPDAPGIVEVWDDDELVYVRASRDSIRKRLVRDLEHVPGLRQHATHFGWEITRRADAREGELLAEFEAEHHRAPRYNLSGSPTG